MTPLERQQIVEELKKFGYELYGATDDEILNAKRDLEYMKKQAVKR